MALKSCIGNRALGWDLRLLGIILGLSWASDLAICNSLEKLKLAPSKYELEKLSTSDLDLLGQAAFTVY